MKKSLYFFNCIAYLFLFASCISQNKNTFSVTETYCVLSSNESISYLSVELPLSYGYQSIDEIKIENADRYFLTQNDNHQNLFAEITSDVDEKMVTISYNVTLLSGKYLWDAIIKNEYLLPSEFIDSDNQTINALASNLKVAGDDYRTAKNISKYVTENLNFDRSVKTNQKTLCASEVLKNKKGVCQDYANLMTALLRASGIPSKSVSSLVLDRLQKTADWSSPAGSHAWVEFFINGKWYFADPTWGTRYFSKPDGYHLSYGIQPHVNSNEYKFRKNEIKKKWFYCNREYDCANLFYCMVK